MTYNNLTSRALNLISDFRPYHSNFQLHNFVIGPAEFGDDSDESAYGIMLQSQREIQARISSINTSRAELHKLQLVQLEHETNARRWICWTKKQKLLKKIGEAEAQRIDFDLEVMKANLIDVLRELQVFVDRAEKVAARVRAWSAEKKESVEEFWFLRKFERRLNSAKLYGSTSSDILEALADIPEAARRRLTTRLATSTFKLDSVHTAFIRLTSEHSFNGRRLHHSDVQPLADSVSSQSAGLLGSFPSTALAYQAPCNH